MPLRHLVVTPLPNGHSGTTLNLSVHLSPRLREDGVLADYADFADWGQFVTNAPALQFEVLINGAVRPGVTVATVSPPVDPAVWRALFGRPPTAVPVKAFAFQDRSNIDLVSIDSGALSDQTMVLARAMSALGAAATKADVLAASGSLLNGDLSSAQQFFARIGNGDDPPPPSTEFHDQLGPLGAHPFLMRVLGLVFDLEVTLPAGAAAVTDVAVRTNWPAKAGTAAHDEVPMRVSVDANFKAAVQQPEYHEEDWLSLGGPKYVLSQLDLANATQQLAHLVDDLSNASDPTSAVEVPALLEGGLSIICGDLGDVLRARLERQREVEDGIDDWLRNKPNTLPPILFAEDITLGFRCDVADATAPDRRSLHDRQVPIGYQFPRNKTLAVKPPADEGWSSITLFTDGSEVGIPQSTNVRYSQEGGPDIHKTEERDQTSWRVDDHITTWGGWSLAAPRVGNSTTGSGAVKPREQNVPAPGSPTQLIVDYAHVNGTLPRLRYGRSYTFRSRCVDLAGHGPVLAETAPASAESDQVQFGRLAPLVPPLPVRHESRPDPGVGDLPDVLVIKSELHQRDRATPPADRLLFPPRISQSRLERHDLPAGGVKPGRYGFIAERDAVSLSDETITDPETGELVAGAALVDGQVTTGPTKPAVGYLVDPVAGSAAFIGLPGGTNGDAVTMTYGRWPHIAAVQLQLKAGSGAPRLARPRRRVTVTLPKGTVATAELSTAPEPSRLAHMAFGQDLAADALDAALSGLNPSLSPRRPITFVHAVRLPLLPPSFGTMTATRTDVGQTDVLLAGALGVHRATTDHVVLRSRWTDPVDDPAADGPADQVTKKVVTDLAIALAGESETETLDHTSLELGDTKRRRVELVAEGFCRFSRYFTERIDFVSGDPANALVLSEAGVVSTSVALTRLDGSERFERNVHFAVDGASGQLRVLDSMAIPPGTECRVEFIPLPVSRLSLQARGAAKKFTFDVPASAPPDLPSVLAVLPAFSRTVTESDSEITVVHDGRVLRLHLARPWFSSGAGELLGVAIDADASLTRWARDPLTAGAGPTTEPTTATFAKATTVASGVDGAFDVAGHEVAFDAERRFWVADVLIDARFGYRPFVELHVCRYQPLALEGQHLSAAVQLDPMRLGVVRKVTVSNDAGDSVGVGVSGPDNVNVVTVVLQEADASIADPDLRWHDVSTTTLTRAGTRRAATHSGAVSVPQTGNERRLVIDDAEPVTVEVDGALEPGTVVAYREVIPIPADW